MPNRLESVSDAGAGALPGVEQFVDGNTSGSDYGYDNSGNLTVDLNKGIASIQYNHLNKPTLVTFSNSDKIAYIYDAAGSKLRQKVFENSTAVTKQSDYIGPFHYEDSDGDAAVAKLELQFFSHEEGRVRRAGNDLVYETSLKDHLGNTRVMFADLDENGWIDPATGGGEVMQVDHYYPFGMRMSGTSPALATAAMPNVFTYNGKEYQDELNLGWHDYGARMYDASVGRWNGVDSLAEKMNDLSPYNYVANNPILLIDPDGNEPSNCCPDFNPYAEQDVLAQISIEAQEMLASVLQVFNIFYTSIGVTSETEIVKLGTDEVNIKGTIVSKNATTFTPNFSEHIRSYRPAENATTVGGHTPMVIFENKTTETFNVSATLGLDLKIQNHSLTMTESFNLEDGQRTTFVSSFSGKKNDKGCCLRNKKE